MTQRRSSRTFLPFLILVLTLLPVAAHAQNGFNALYSRDGIDVWAVGGSGVLYRSFDSGVTWTTKTIGVDTHRGVAAQGWTVLLVSDNGKINRSTDSGGTFTTTTVAGSPSLRAVQLIDASTGWIVGALGTILKTTDGGANWTTQTSGVAVRLNALKFLDASTGWVVGDGGTILATVDGGANWTPQTSGTTNALYSVDATTVGAATPVVWAVGAEGTALKSIDAGASFTPQPMKIDSHADVNGVWLESATNVILVGGGGFIRASADGGATWYFRQHTMQGEMTDIFYYAGTKAWACNRTNRVVLRSTDSGVGWSLPAGASVSRSLNLKQVIVAGSMRGSTLAQHGTHRNTYYCVLGNRVYKSQDRGETWAQIGISLPSASQTNAFYVNPADSLVMIAATGNGGSTSDHLARTTDGGNSWTTIPVNGQNIVPFTEYGVPLEMDVNDPNHMIFAPEDGKLWQSNDFGLTWSLLSNPGFRSPCDVQILPDQASTIWVGDGVTGSGAGQMFVSTNSGASFSLNYTTSGSEVPMIAATRLDVGVGWSTHWGSGGVRRTKDAGSTWPVVNNTSSAWGVDVAKDDPNMMTFGVYSGGFIYLSFDEGTTYTSVGAASSNYSIWIPDRNTVLTEQGTGIYKLSSTYTVAPTSSQSVIVLAPNGGEVWDAGSSHFVSYSANNIALARIEYRDEPGQPWQVIGYQTGYVTSFNWTVPNDATTKAKLRCVDAADGAPIDSSNAFFTIAAPRADLLTSGVDFGIHPVGIPTTIPVTIHSSGTGPLHVTGISHTSGAYTLGRTAFTIAAADTDTVGVTFIPPAPGAFPDTLVITSDAPDSPHQVPLGGSGQLAPAVALLAPDGGESWVYNSVQTISWSSATISTVDIDYETSPGGGWAAIATGIPASPGSYDWTVPYTPTSQARVRVRDTGGAVVDQSAADFSITAPLLADLPDTVDCGVVVVGSSGCVVITLDNDGTAPLLISGIASDSPRFAPVRTAITIPAASSDTLTICFSPVAVGIVAGTLTLSSNDPFAPHNLPVTGHGQTQSGTPDGSPRPTAWYLAQNHPNPFSGSTRILYGLPEHTMVTLEVFDPGGRKVATLFQQEQDAGRYSVDFGPGARTAGGDAVGEFPSGVYFYRLTAGSWSRTNRMLFVH